MGPSSAGTCCTTTDSESGESTHPRPVAAWWRMHLSLRLLEPEAHVHLTVLDHRAAEVLVGRLPLARTSIQLAKPEMAVSDEGTHFPRLGERQCFAILVLGALGIEPIGMGRDGAEQVPRISRTPGLALIGFDLSLAITPSCRDRDYPGL
jgi:hypothetical protein